MIMSKQNVPVVRIALGALFFVALLTQFWVVPSVAAESAARYPEHASLAPLYLIVIGIAIGLFELALLAGWQVLSAAATNTGSQRSRWWAIALLVALGSSGALFASVFVHAGSVAGVGGPPMLFGLLVSVAVVICAIALRRKALEFTVEDDNDWATRPAGARH